MHTRRDVGVARQIGTYSDAIEVAPGQRWLFSAGTPGLTADGTLPPDITGQAEIAWTHILAMLERASMTVHHLVKVTHCLLARPTSRPTPRCARASSATRGQGPC